MTGGTALLVLSLDALGNGTVSAAFDSERYERAHEYARNTGAVVVSVPIVADYRPAERGADA